MRIVVGVFVVAMAAALMPLQEPVPPTVAVTPPRIPADPPASDPAHGDVAAVAAIRVAGGFDQPLEAVWAPGDERMFVVEKPGLVWAVGEGGEVGEEPFLDLRTVVAGKPAEQGLLGMAFHPGYAANGRFFVHYTDVDGDDHLVEFRSEPGGPVDVTTARWVLLVEEPQQFHNGGTLRFGPDGYLYFGLGDGGGIGDPFANAAEPRTLLGSILRIDVDAAHPYAVPADNPFAGGGGAPEVWAYGLRNPWRFFIDPVDRVVVIGDVGQFRVEEVSLVPLDSRGADLGWPTVEGDECFRVENCDAGDAVAPVLVYRHHQGCAVQAGPVYRGSALPGLRGWVLYSDFCSGWVRAFAPAAPGAWKELLPAGTFAAVLSLAVDPDGEVYVLSGDGTIWMLAAASDG